MWYSLNLIGHLYFGLLAILMNYSLIVLLFLSLITFRSPRSPHVSMLIIVLQLPTTLSRMKIIHAHLHEPTSGIWPNPLAACISSSVTIYSLLPPPWIGPAACSCSLLCSPKHNPHLYLPYTIIPFRRGILRWGGGQTERLVITQQSKMNPKK